MFFKKNCPTFLASSLRVISFYYYSIFESRDNFFLFIYTINTDTNAMHFCMLYFFLFPRIHRRIKVVAELKFKNNNVHYHHPSPISMNFTTRELLAENIISCSRRNNIVALYRRRTTLSAVIYYHCSGDGFAARFRS